MADPGMHAPCYAFGHTLTSAGKTDIPPSDVFRFNRPIPYYEPDPCIQPNRTDLTCPPLCNPVASTTRNDLMPPAGKMSEPADVFRFYSVRPPKPEQACCTGDNAERRPCSSLGPIPNPDQCPCINRFNASNNVHNIPSVNPHGYNIGKGLPGGISMEGWANGGDYFRQLEGARAPTPLAMSQGSEVTQLGHPGGSGGTSRGQTSYCLPQCPPEKGIRSYDPRDIHPTCLEAHPKPTYFKTPIFGMPSPYVQRASTCPLLMQEKPVTKKPCRQRRWKSYADECPESDADIGPRINMFLFCDN